MKRTRYRLIRVNAATQEQEEVPLRDPKGLTKTQADLVMKMTGANMSPWFYSKVAIKEN